MVDSSGQQAVVEFSKMTVAADVLSPKDIWGMMLNPFQRSI